MRRQPWFDKSALVASASSRTKPAGIIQKKRGKKIKVARATKPMQSHTNSSSLSLAINSGLGLQLQRRIRNTDTADVADRSSRVDASRHSLLGAVVPLDGDRISIGAVRAEVGTH